MLVTQSAVVGIPASLAVIVTIRETGVANRTLCFENLTSNEISISLEESADNTNWTQLEPSFVLGVAGSATGVVVKDTASTNIIRVRASGGGDDRDVSLSYLRVVEEAAGVGRIWTRPSL